MKKVTSILIVGLMAASGSTHADLFSATSQVSATTSAVSSANLTASGPGPNSGVAGSMSFAAGSNYTGSAAAQMPFTSSAGSTSISSADQFNLSMSIGGESSNTNGDAQSSGVSGAMAGPGTVLAW